MTTDDLLKSPEVAAFGPARAGGAADAIDGITPRLVIEPDGAASFAAALAWASRSRLATVIRGGGSKRDWGRVPRAVDLALATTRLNRLVAHRHGDLTATFEAGARLADLRPVLARERQWLAIDSAFDAATIGGIVATNDSGPSRHRHGTPRDLLIGVTLALTDGRLVKSGGHVVKNVAGYDLGKLVSGSYGSLAAIVDATFKLAPIPAASATAVAHYGDADTLARDVVALMASQLEPAAVDVQARFGAGPPYALCVRFATSPAALEAQVGGLRTLLTVRAETVNEQEEAALWDEQLRRPWRGSASDGAVVRVSWLPASIGAVLALVADLDRTAPGTVELAGRVATGTGVLRIDRDSHGQIAAIARLRGDASPVGNVVVLRANPAVKAQVDVWGVRGDLGGALTAIKQAFDPTGILNANRGVV